MTSTGMDGKRSKPGRPTKRIQKQLDAIDAQMEKLSDDIPDEEGDDHADRTESEQPRFILFPKKSSPE